jgi:hypothetical protein
LAGRSSGNSVGIAIVYIATALKIPQLRKTRQIAVNVPAKESAGAGGKLIHISFCEGENMKLLVLLLVFCGLPTNVLSAQSSLPGPNHQVTKPHVTTKKQPSPEEAFWCPVLESALAGADGAWWT